MHDEINQKINLARYLLLKRNFSEADSVLKEVEQLAFQMQEYAYLASLFALQNQARAGMAAEMAAPGAPPSPPPGSGAPTVDVDLVLTIEDGHPEPHLTPALIAYEVTPFLIAMEGLQHALDRLVDNPSQPVIIHHLGQNSPCRLVASGIARAARETREVLVPWRDQHTSQRAVWAANRAAFAQEIDEACHKLALQIIDRLPCSPPSAERDRHIASMAAPLAVLIFGRVSIST